MVTFSDLSTWNQDKTIINGGNITTGQIHNKARTTTYDLDNAWIRMGKDAGTRVDIDTGRIRWYWENNLTGVLSSRYGKSYIGDNSRYTFLGWFSTGDPSFDYSTGGATSEFVGIAIDQVDKVIHILATLALLLVLALVIPLTLAACGGTRTEDTSYPRPEYSGSPMAERVMK